MAIYTFSTRTKKPLDTAAVDRAKQYCDDNGLNFSALIVMLIKNWEAESDRKIQSAIKAS